MKKSLCIFLSSILALLLASCGYQFGYGGIPSVYKTVTIPFVQGDFSGALTAELTHQISSSGALKVLSANGDLLLCVRVLDQSDENIGFRYDRDEQGCIEETLVPAETRRTIVAEVSLLDRCSRERVSGPDILRASVEFDHEFNSSRDGVNVFSLGQVTDIDQAVDAAMRPLNAKLAEKIVNYLINAW